MRGASIWIAALVVPLADPAVAAPASNSAAASAIVPVPRTDFIATMDTEFHHMDADKNGILTKKEVEDYERAMSAAAVDDRRRALFAALDADHNGTLTPGEFARLQVPPPPINVDSIVGPADLNHDGSISLVEWRTAKLANFDRMDADKDGVVSPAEMKAAGLTK